MFREISFDWDQWNVQKNETKHGVSCLEAESAFYDSDYKLFYNIKHSVRGEKRYILYGYSIEQRVLMIGFTIRGQRIRIITARPASKKERALYEEKK